MDGEFDKDGLVGDVAELGITINCVAAEEHVPEIERHIRTIKERSRSVVGMLPFKQLPARIIIELIHYVVFWLNSFPVQRGISDVLSPRALVVGSTIDYATHCKIEFGAYVQTHEPHNNSMLRARRVPLRSAQRVTHKGDTISTALQRVSAYTAHNGQSSQSPQTLLIECTNSLGAISN